jgi:hypothetical protein
MAVGGSVAIHVVLHDGRLVTSVAEAASSVTPPAIRHRYSFWSIRARPAGACAEARELQPGDPGQVHVQYQHVDGDLPEQLARGGRVVGLGSAHVQACTRTRALVADERPAPRQTASWPRARTGAQERCSYPR